MSAARSTTPWLKVAPPASSTLSSLISAIRPDSLAVDFSISPSILRWVSVSAPVRAGHQHAQVPGDDRYGGAELVDAEPRAGDLS